MLNKHLIKSVPLIKLYFHIQYTLKWGRREVKWRREMLGNFWDKRMNIEYNYVIFCMCVVTMESIIMYKSSLAIL